MSSAARIIPVILCGGAGTRLWPLSRRARPKQMLAIGGSASLLRATAARVADASVFAPPVLVTGAAQADAAEAELRQAGVESGLTIVEPSARSTAAAIALAALAAEPDDLLLIMPSDHLIADPAGLVAAVRAGAPLAEDGWLVTFGMRPDRAETGYGYIKRGEPLAEGVFRADSFVEKPDAETAARLVAEGGHDWNGGIFLMRAGTLLDELGVHAPDVAAAATGAMAGARRDGIRLHPDARSFDASPARSIDRAVMEHAPRIAVVPVEIGWSDVGSWQAIYDAGARDGDGNVLEGETLAIDAKGCLIRSDGPLIAAIGVEDLAIVATGDVVLVVPRSQSQRVQEIVAALSKKDDPRL